MDRTAGVPGHETHLHLAADGGIFKLNDKQYQYLFGGQAGGRNATFQEPITPAVVQQEFCPLPHPPAQVLETPPQPLSLILMLSVMLKNVLKIMQR